MSGNTQPHENRTSHPHEDLIASASGCTPRPTDLEEVIRAYARSLCSLTHYMQVSTNVLSNGNGEMSAECLSCNITWVGEFAEDGRPMWQVQSPIVSSASEDEMISIEFVEPMIPVRILIEDRADGLSRVTDRDDSPAGFSESSSSSSRTREWLRECEEP